MSMIEVDDDLPEFITVSPEFSMSDGEDVFIPAAAEVVAEPVGPAPTLASDVEPVSIEQLVTSAATIKAVNANAGPNKRNQRLARIAEEIGEDVSVLRRSPTDALAAMKDGVLCNLHIKWWRGGSKLESGDLALNVDSEIAAFAKDALKLGTKRLVPAVLHKELMSSESCARAALYAASIKTSHGKFVPTCRFKEFREIFVEARTQFMLGIESLCAQLPAIRKDIYERFAPLAKRAWLGARARWTENGQFPEGHFTEVAEATDLYTHTFLAGIEAQVPSEEEIRAKVVFEYTLSVLQAPDTDLALEFATSDEEVNAELAKHLIQQKKNYIDDFLVALHQGLIDNVQRFCKDVGATLEKKDLVHGKTLNKVLGTIKSLHEFNLTGNQSIEAQLQRLEEFVELKRGAGKVSALDLKVQIDTIMGNIVNMSESAIKEVQANNPDLNINVGEE